MVTEVKVPQLPESVADALIAAIVPKVGDTVREGDRLVDLETDKIMLEVPSEVSGVVEEIVVEEGQTVVSEQLMLKIKAGDVAAAAPQQQDKEIGSVDMDVAEKTKEDNIGSQEGLSPTVRRLMQINNLNSAQIQGTGKNQRITQEDVEAFLASQKSAESATVPAEEVSTGSRTERRLPMSRLRTRVAERLLEVQKNSAILTTFNEVNMGPVMALRKQYKDDFEKKHGVRLGYMSFFIQAAVAALKAFPSVNASIDGSDIVYHEFFDIGVAVSTERGLVVPVLKNAEHMSMDEIERGVRGFAEKARNNRLTLDDITGGTFSITNGGVFGSMMSTPIINPPQSAILGMHNIINRPIAVNGKVEVAPMMYLALSYDHRLIDGGESVRFLVMMKEMLEYPARLLLDL